MRDELAEMVTTVCVVGGLVLLICLVKILQALHG